MSAGDLDGRGGGTGGSRRDLDLFDLIALLWAQKVLAIVTALIVFVPIALLAVTQVTPSYEAVSRLLVIQDDNDLAPGAAGSGGAFTLDQVMQSEAEILNSDAVRRLAIEQRSGAVGPQQLKLLRELQEENSRLKRMYADLSLDHELLKEIIEKKL